jgi:hypothetical protein
MAYLRSALGTGRQNDIVDQGKVNRNFVLDEQLIREKKRILASQNRATHFPGTSNNEAFSIFKGELMFTVCETRPGNHVNNNPAVFSNFIGHEHISSDPNYDPEQDIFRSYEDEIDFVGISVGGGSVYDDKTKRQLHSIAGTCGGTQTITNNGTDKLKNGDLIMWKHPRNKEKNNEYKGSERWLAQIEVYDASKHRLDASSFLHYLSDPEKYEDSVDSVEVPFKQECKALKEIFKQIQGKADFLADAANVGSEERASLEKMFVIINRFNMRMKRRIFAQVLSPAEPGQKVDILLKNSYELY